MASSRFLNSWKLVDFSDTSDHQNPPLKRGGIPSGLVNDLKPSPEASPLP